MDIKQYIRDFFSKQHTENIYIDIFKIIKRNGENYTENNSGMFFDLSKCKNETILSIHSYILSITKTIKEHNEYMENTRIEIDKIEKQMKKCNIKDQKVKKKQKQNTAKTPDDLFPKKRNYKKNGVYSKILECMKPNHQSSSKKIVEIEFNDFIADEEVSSIHSDLLDEVSNHSGEIEVEPEIDEKDLFGSDSE